MALLMLRTFVNMARAAKPPPLLSAVPMPRGWTQVGIGQSKEGMVCHHRPPSQSTQADNKNDSSNEYLWKLALAGRKLHRVPSKRDDEVKEAMR